jgi:hypothetical protein
MIVEARKDLPGAFRSVKRLVVFAEQDHRLDQTAQSPRSLIPVAQLLVKLESLLMVLDRSTIVAGGIKRICFCAQTERHGLSAAQPLRDEHGGLGQVECFLRAYPHLLDDERCQLLDNFLADQLFVFGKKFAAGSFGG